MKSGRLRGFSLIELLIAIGLGLLLTAAVGFLYVSNAKLFRKQDDDARLQETARAAMDTLGYHIRMAGYVDTGGNVQNTQNLKLVLSSDPSNRNWLAKTNISDSQDMITKFFNAQYSTAIQAVSGCEGLYVSTSPVFVRPWNCTTTGSSSITVAYQVRATDKTGSVRSALSPSQDTLGVYDAATGQGADCGGFDVTGATADPAGPLAINRFYVDSVTKRLMCIGNGDPTKPRPIAEGVEDLRILYGVAPIAPLPNVPMDTSIGQYAKATDVTNWARVLAVRVCMQVATPTKNLSRDVKQYVDCNGATQNTSDGKIRQIVRTTFSLRNNVLTSPDKQNTLQ